MTFVQPIYRSMYALTGASGTTSMTRIIGWGWAARKKTPRGQPGRRRQGHVRHLVCDLLTDCGGSVASPRCSLTVVASPPFSFPLSMRPYRFFSFLAACAQEDFCFQQYRQEEHCQ